MSGRAQTRIRKPVEMGTPPQHELREPQSSAVIEVYSGGKWLRGCQSDESKAAR